MMIRWDDLGDDQDVEKCRWLWDTAHLFGFTQILAVVANGLNENTALIDLIKANLGRGGSLALHGYTHIRYPKMSYEEQLSEMRKGVSKLRKLFGVAPKYFAPPYNSWDKNTMLASKQCGMILEHSNHSFITFTEDDACVVCHPQWGNVKTFKTQLERIKERKKVK